MLIFHKYKVIIHLSYTFLAKKHHKLFCLFCSLFILVLLGCNNMDPERSQKTILLAHAIHLHHPVSVAMERMAELLDQYSVGKLKFGNYPTGQLGGGLELLELVHFGAIGMTNETAGSLENIAPEIRAFRLPYLFRGSGHMANLLWIDVGEDIQVTYHR